MKDFYFVCVKMFSTVLTLSVAFAIGQSTASSRISNSTFNATLTNADTRAFPTMPIRNVSFSDELLAKDINKTEMIWESHSPLQETSFETSATTTTFIDSNVSTTNAFTISPAENHNDSPITSDPKEDMITTWTPDDATTTSDEPTEETTPTNVVENLSMRGTVINCFCDVDQVFVDGNCVPVDGGTFVIMRVARDDYKTFLAPMADREAIISDLVCDTESGSRILTFSSRQFRLRDRGDIVLLQNAGELNGLRSNNYCISHFLDGHGDLTWTAKVCVEPPRVPRCCPPGKSMKNNVCLPSRTPEILEPPISADPYGFAVSWPYIKNYEKPLHCTEEPMKDIPLIPGESYLTSHTDGMAHIWISEETDYNYVYSFDYKYCVDGRQNLDGSTSYSVKMCFESPTERHHRMCDDKVCVRKCCQFGEILDSYLTRCVPGASEFAPHMNTDYNVIVGFPLKGPTTPVVKFSLSPDTGYLSTWNETLPTKWNITLPPTEYCIDTFSDREGRLTTGALARVYFFSKWEEVKTTVFPVCMSISLFFLVLIVICYVTVPILLANTGKSHLCHVLSLIVAYSSGVLLHFFQGFIKISACVGLGITMQFGYLSAFFWLSVLCFDVWRLFRSLESKLRPPTPIPPYVYHIYAWGGPLLICSATLTLQYIDTHGIPWLIKPHLGMHKCWFGPNMEEFVFFYLYIAILLLANCIFIAHTYWIKRKMDRSLSAVRGDKNENGAKRATESTFRTRDVYSEFFTKFLLLALISTCWVTEVLSWKIPPMELWAVTDVINTLQGFFIFVIFLQDRRKRKHLKEKFPKMFGFFKSILLVLKKVKNTIPCSHLAKGTFSPSTYISTLNRKLSSSSLVSNLSTLSSSLKLSSTSSLEIGKKANTVKKSKSVGEDNGIVTLSFTQIPQISSDSFSSNSSIC